MDPQRRRFYIYLTALVGVVVGYTLAYKTGMAMFENETRSFTESLLVVVETFTTTGYGEDAIWDTPQMIGLMVVMQLTGVMFIFMALPLFVVPWIERTLSTSPPRAIDGLEDHVLICAYTHRSELLVEELERNDVPYVVIEPDRAAATGLVEDGVTVIHGDPETEEAITNACIRDARALVADAGDETNAAIALAAAEVCEEEGVTVITFTEDPEIVEYHEYAGADRVLSPRQLIGESLASKVTTAVTDNVGGAVEIGEDFEIAEFPVQPGSEIEDSTIAESGIREQTGANVVGAWFHGEFASPPPPDTRIDGRTILLVAGREDQLERLKELTLTEKRRRRRGPVVVCGHGKVGSTVSKRVQRAGLPCTVIDIRDRPNVDVVGDATDTETLEAADIENASTVVLALSDDTEAVFATLVIRQLDPQIEVVARASDTESVRNLYRAGADYVLALSTVSGRMLAATVLEEDVISYDQQVEVVRVPCGDLAGETLASADIRARTGCTVVAVERDGDIITDLDPDFAFHAGDEVIVAGPDENVDEFTALFG